MALIKRIWDALIQWGEIVYECRKNTGINRMY